MKKSVVILANIIAVMLIVFGSTGFLSYFSKAIEYDNIGYNKYYIQNPLYNQQGFAIDSKGNIYMGTMDFSGIQVYDINGKFIYGMSFPTGWGGYFEYFIDDSDILHVVLYRPLEEYTIHDGEVINKIKNIDINDIDRDYQLMNSNSISRPSGTTYIKESSKKINVYKGSELIKQVILDTPNWPLSSTTFFVFNVLGFFILAFLHRKLFRNLKGFKK